MKKVLLLTIASLMSPVAISQVPIRNSLTSASVKELPVIRNQLGTGTPSVMDTGGIENAVYIDDQYYHIPQYMPNFPTAATIWPRVVSVECEKIQDRIVCDGYHWLPKMGRGEYLFLVPQIKSAPVTITPPVPPVNLKPVIVYIEVPEKKKKE